MSKNYVEGIKNAGYVEVGESLEESGEICAIKPHKFQNVKVSSVFSNSQSIEHLSYETYKAAGEYWNKYPKTDYTYSRFSPHRREIAPGVLAMPNMSRKSLTNHCCRISQSITNINQNPDFDDHYDIVHHRAQNYQNTKFLIKFMRVSPLNLMFNSIATFIALLRKKFSNTEGATYWNKPEENTGMLSTFHLKALQCVQQMYVLTANVLYMDTALLPAIWPKSSIKKRFSIIMFMLWSLLFVSVSFLAEENPTIQHMRNLFPITPIDLISTFPSYIWSEALKFDWFTAPIHVLEPSLKGSTRISDASKPLDNNELNTMALHIKKYLQNSFNSNNDDPVMLAQLSKVTSKEIFELLKVFRDGFIDPEEKSENRIYDFESSNMAKLVTKRFRLEWNYIKQNYLSLIIEKVKKSFIQDMRESRVIDDVILRMKNSEYFLIVIKDLVMKINKNEIWKEKQLMLDKFNSFEEQYTCRSYLKQKEYFEQALARLNSDAVKAIEQGNDLKEMLEQLKKDISVTDLNLRNLQSNLHSYVEEKVGHILRHIFKLNYDDANDSPRRLFNEYIENNMFEGRLQAALDIQDRKFKEYVSLLIIEKDKFVDETKDEIIKELETRFRNKIQNTKIDIALSKTEIMSIISDALKLYDADKTGLVDYALESAGGQVLSTRCTETYETKSAQLTIFGIPLWYPVNTPRIAISPSVQPGECWAFRGFPGFLVIKLNTAVFVNGFTLEHIPKRLTPHGTIDSAPKNFTVWGLTVENDANAELFGEYEFADNDVTLQHFPVQYQVKQRIDIVELRIESNHGNKQYTCLYRFRVHGTPNL